MYGGADRYVKLEVLGAYWCSLCGVVHYQQPASEEYVMKTGWQMVGERFYNIGYCNGVHVPPDAPVYLGKRNLVRPSAR